MKSLKTLFTIIINIIPSMILGIRLLVFATLEDISLQKYFKERDEYYRERGEELDARFEKFINV